MNRGAIKQLAADFAEDPDMTRFAGKYDTSLDRAQEQFCLDSRTLWKDTTISFTANDEIENLPSDFMMEKAVTWDGIELKPISRATLEYYKTDDRWDDDTATDPLFYLIHPEQATKAIEVYPIPTEAGTLVLTYYPLPATSTDDTATPLNSSALHAQFHPALAAYQAWLLLGGVPVTPAIGQKRKELFDQYMRGVAQAVEDFRNTAGEPWRMKGGRVWRRDF